jgi:two-component sensor histidine kinase
MRHWLLRGFAAPIKFVRQPVRLRSVRLKAPSPPDNLRRVEVLRSYGMLDTPPERDFDDVVGLASKLCDVPVSLITLIDADRQWTKAQVGVELDDQPLGHAICTHAIVEEGFTEIPDTLDDPRTADNPFCKNADGARFYAGAVLRTPEGHALGTLCVLDTKPRVLTELQREALQVLARQVMAQMEMRRALALAETLRREVDHRVKNSLQSLSALAGIKARVANAPEAKEALLAIQKRIHTVSMLHEQLYKADAGAMVNLGQYLRNVTNYLGAQAPSNIAIRCEADELFVPSEQAAAVGTLINEFVANSLKHAFPDARGGAIGIRLEAAASGRAVVEAFDDGIGAILGALTPTHAGLGTQIMQATAQQLGGALEVDLGGGGIGARMSLVFTPASGA